MNPGAHVVNTVSLSCYVAHLDDDFLHPDPYSYHQIGTYANTKMAVMLFSEELHRRYGEHITVHVTDPGIVNSRILRLGRWFDPVTDILFRPFCKSPKRGAKPAVNALLYTATYGNPLFLFRGNRHLSVPRRWKHPNTARWLWDETEKLLQL